MACKCKITMQFLRDIGASHAATMHLAPGAIWTSKDWLLHFQEEKELLYPIILKYFSRGQIIVDQIEAEHQIFKGEISMFGSIRNTRLLEAHAAYEDDIVIQLAKLLKKRYAA